MSDTPKSDTVKPSRGLWIKLYHAILDDEKLCAIKLLPEGHFHVLVFVDLLVLAGKINKFGRFMLTQDRQMTIDEISNQLRIKSVNFYKTLEILNEFELIVFNSDKCLEIMNWEKYQDVDISERKKEQDRIRQNRKRTKKIRPSDPLSKNPDQQTFDDYAKSTDFLPKNDIVTEMSHQSHTNVAPIDTDTELDVNKDTDKDDDKTTVEKNKVSSSSFKFDDEKEGLIKKYVEYKFLNGEIIKTRSSYEKGVRTSARDNEQDFTGMVDYINKFEDEAKDREDKARENLVAMGKNQIEEAKKQLDIAIIAQIEALSDSDKKVIEKKAHEYIAKEYPSFAKKNIAVLPPLMTSATIVVYHDIRRKAHFETVESELFCGTGKITDIDSLEFIIDFAIANKLSIDTARSILIKQKIKVPNNYSIIYRDKEMVAEMLGVYSKFDWFKEERSGESGLKDS